MRRGQDAQRDPTAALKFHVEGHIPQRAIGQEICLCHRKTVHDDFQGDFARVSDPSALHVPIRFLVVSQVMQSGVGLFIEQSRDFCRHANRPRLFQAELAFLFADRGIIHLELQKMASTIARIITPFAYAFTPIIKIQFGAKLHIGAPQTHPLAINAREVRLATDSRAKASVERLIPDVQLPNIGRVH